MLFALLVACGSADEREAEEVLLPASFPTSGFVEVRSCRAPGEHSALGGFKVWVNDDAKQALDDLWAGKTREMPANAIVAKETFGGPDCAPADLVATLVMKKVAGSNPAAGDWRWEERDASGRTDSGASPAGCIGCHEGRASCTSYGALGDKDYLCTEP